MSSPGFRERLATRLQQVGLTVSQDLAGSLETYFALLSKWNRTINLAGMQLDDPTPDAIDRLIVEPLFAARKVQDIRRMIDIGSGGGSPAIPMALALHPSELAMVESRARKAVFLTEAIRSVGIPGGNVVNARYETLLSDARFVDGYDLLTIRAVRVSSEILATLQRLVRPGGLVMVFARADGESDLLSAPAPLALRGQHDLSDQLTSRVILFEKSSANP